MIINQWIPAAHYGDAVGNSARVVRNLLRSKGYVSNIFALTIDEELQGDVRFFSEPEATSGDSTILHFAVPSLMSEALTHLSGGRIIQYHNITPAHFFASYAPDIFRIAAVGRHELANLVGRVDLALGDSEFNRAELEALGFKKTGVFPIAVDTKRIQYGEPNPALEDCLTDGLSNILFVGRIAPNKKIEDNLRLAEYFRRYVDRDYRFIFVGRTDAVPRYYATIRSLMAKYGMRDDRFVFTGAVPNEDLATYYKTAKAYVSLSEHEGFCVPLVEAMAADLPILAYGTTAIPETLGGAGICFTPKDLEYAAEVLGMLVYDDKLRNKIISGQRKRLIEFSPASVDAALQNLLASLT